MRTKLGLAVLIGLQMSGVSFAAQVAGVVSAIRGTAEVHRPPAAGWATVTKGAFLYEGDKLKVGPKSVCGVTLLTGVEIRLNAGAVFEVPAREAGERGGWQRVKLNKGGAWARWLGASGKKFEMRTPTATIGVRGTEWSVEADEGQTEVVCYSGSVEVGNAYGAVLLKPGEKTSAGAGGAPAQPEKLPEDKKRSPDWTNEVKGRGTLKVIVSVASAKVGEAVGMTIEARKSDGKLATGGEGAPKEIELKGDGLEVSGDAGATWGATARAALTAGAAKAAVRRATPGSGQVMISAEGYPATALGLSVSGKGEPKSRLLKVKVKGPDGTEEELQLRYKKE